MIVHRCDFCGKVFENLHSIYFETDGVGIDKNNGYEAGD